MKEPLKDRAKEYFNEFRLPESQMNKLQKIQDASTLKKYQRKNILIPFSQVASVILFITVAIVSYTKYENTSLSKLVSEIAYHHNKHMNMEIKSNSLNEIKTYLAKLDFSLIQSVQLPEQEWELVGGRYCSLQGILTAQLNIRNIKNNKVYTFYQMVAPDDFGDIKNISKSFEKGVMVKLWLERGLLLGIAGEN